VIGAIVNDSLADSSTVVVRQRAEDAIIRELTKKPQERRSASGHSPSNEAGIVQWRPATLRHAGV